MTRNHTSFEVPRGLPDIVTLGIQLWGDPTKRAPDKVEFGNRCSKIVWPAPANTWHDHEADTGGGYLDLYRLKYGKLPDPPGFPIPTGMAKELGNPVAWWDYQYETGQTVARVVRFHPLGQDKTYRQCRPDGDRWRWKMAGLRIPPYRLPELIQAPTGSRVYITEGEKHADQLRAWGMLATTNAGGAKKFRSDHAAVLARFECVVLPDNDQAGREHRDVVTKALRAAGCQSIRVVNLPGLPPKGDIIDWVAAGGTCQALETMTDAAPVWGGADDWTDPDEPAPAFDEPSYQAADDDPGYQAADDATPDQDPIRALVAEFNDRYMVVSEAGKVILYKPDTDPVLNRRFYQRLEFADFQKMWMNRTIRNGVDKKGDPVFSQVAPLWLRHPDRRQFIGGVIFDPSGSNRDPEKLNLWQGFAVQPRPGSWAKMKDHVRNVICDGNNELNDYVLNWSARMVQFPAEQGEVAIVLKGVEGSGKGTLANALRRIMGQHALKISNAKHLVGNFNSHLRDCVFLFADEAFFAGDKQHVGVLKSIITEDSLTIEAKYANAVETPNYLHLMMASNEEWVVPAGLEARRFLVLLTTATKVRNFAYFKAIHAEMDNGGYEAMLHDLLALDLSDFNVRDVPDTVGLQEQKKLSLGTSEAWWLDVLHRGYVYKSKLGLEDHFGEWHEIETTEVLYASYSEFAKTRNERHPIAREALGRFMVSMGGHASKPRNPVVGEHITDVLINQHGDTTRKAALITKERSTGYSLGDLIAARAAFTDATKLPVEWEPDCEEPA